MRLLIVHNLFLSRSLCPSHTYILGAGARHFDPGLGEEGAGSQHEDDVENSVDGVLQDVRERLRRREVVAQTSDGVGTCRSTTPDVRPHTKQVDQDVPTELRCQHLRDEVQVGHEGALQDDGDVGGVEQLDWIRAVLSSVTGGFDW